MQYELNCPSEPHSSHGNAWTGKWCVDDFDESRVAMSFDPDSDQPVNYSATREIKVCESSLEIRMKVTNRESHRAPFGMGIHPYFARPCEAQIRCSLEKEWILDKELMPIKCVSNVRNPAMRKSARVCEMPETAAYTGDSTDALIFWPSVGLSLHCISDPPMKHAIFWRPDKQDFFCYEAVSHMIDGFNMSESVGVDSGVIFLESGESIAATWKFLVLSNRSQ